MASVAELRRIVSTADRAYRNGNPFMSDAEFDSYVAELRRVAPHAPELLTPGGGTALLSLHTAADAEDFAHWYGTLPTPAVLVEPKLDGVALALRYESGHLTAAWTRSGISVLHVAALVRSIPATLPTTHPHLEIRGELWSDDRRQSTPAAALRRKPTPRSGLGLNFTAYQQTTLPLDEPNSLTYLADLGLDVVPHCLATTAHQAWSVFRAWSANTIWPEFPCDGVVIKAIHHATQQQLGACSRAPKWAVALKP